MPHLSAGRIFVMTTFIFSQAWSLRIPSQVLQDASDHHNLIRRKKDDFNSELDKLPDYEKFQISDGIAGNSLQNAALVFLEPYGLRFDAELEILPVDKLKAVSKDDLKRLKDLARAASNNEKPGFVKTMDNTKDKKIKAALQVGMIANKVFKLVGQQTYLAIELAKGIQDRRQKLGEEKKKLKNNIEFDRKNQGKPMISYLHPDCFPFKSIEKCKLKSGKN